MTLRDWIRATTPSARRLVCGEIGTTMDYLWQIAGGHSRPSVHLSLAIERATGVSRHLLRPDVFGPDPGQDRAA